MDIKRVIEKLHFYSDCSILITGASGLICSAIVDLISEMNLNDKGQVNLFVAVHYLEKGKKRFSKYL